MPQSDGLITKLARKLIRRDIAALKLGPCVGVRVVRVDGADEIPGQAASLFEAGEGCKRTRGYHAPKVPQDGFDGCLRHVSGTGQYRVSPQYRTVSRDWCQVAGEVQYQLGHLKRRVSTEPRDACHWWSYQDLVKPRANYSIGVRVFQHSGDSTPPPLRASNATSPIPVRLFDGIGCTGHAKE